MELDEIGLKIRNGRRALGMTQQELAEKVGYTSKVAISRIEKGDINISMDKMVEIANAIRVPISDFFDTYEKKETPDIFIGLSDQSKKRALEYIETLRRCPNIRTIKKTRPAEADRVNSSLWEGAGSQGGQRANYLKRAFQVRTPTVSSGVMSFLVWKSLTASAVLFP